MKPHVPLIKFPRPRKGMPGKSNLVFIIIHDIDNVFFINYNLYLFLYYSIESFHVLTVLS